MKRRLSRCLLVAGPLLALSILPACGSRGAVRAGRPELARATVQEPRQRSFDVESYALDLVLVPDERRIEGTCTVRLQPIEPVLEVVELDLLGLEVDDVEDAAGNALAFSHEGGVLTTALAEPLGRGEFAELKVRYGGRPVTGLWFSGTRLDGSGPTIAFTHGQAEHTRGWMPCFDHPSERATFELRLTVPEGWIAVAPGERVEARDEGGEHVEHWTLSSAHPCYLFSVVAGEFVQVEDRWDGVPLLYLVEPQYEDWIERTFEETDEILAFLSSYTGIRYPYPKYSQAAVANFPWGGMENVSATTLSPLILTDERGERDQPATELIAHEAAHQWFGDLFTCADWSHLWLNEGFATYLALLYFEETRGVDEFRARLFDARRAYLIEDRGAARRPTVSNVWKEPEDLLDTRCYQGAAARLHLLRFVLGDDVFRRGVRTYAAENAGKSVVTADFQRAMEKVSGRELDDFFEQWFEGRGYPEFQIDWEWDEDEAEVRLEVEQVQAHADGTPAVFRTPVDVEIRDERGTRLHRLEIDERRERFELPSPSRPFYVTFDKYGWIPKAVRFEASGAEWLAVVSSEDDVNARREAASALGRLASESHGHAAYVHQLSELLTDDENAWVRADAATALGVARRNGARKELEEAATRDAEARVRVASLVALRVFGEDEELAALAERVFDEGYSWDTMGAAAGLFCTSAPSRAFDWIVARLYVDSPHDVLSIHLFRCLAALQDGRASDELARWAADESLAPQARGVALLSLAENPAAGASEFVAGFLDAEDFRLRMSAIHALARLASDDALRALRGHYPRTRTADERRAIEAALSGQAL